MSGAGKSQAIKCLEDIGFFCIDNLPTTLTPTFARLCMQSEPSFQRVALVIDVREGEFPTSRPGILATLRAEGHDVKIAFLDASDEALVRRFSESRRPHPLAAGRAALPGITLEPRTLAGPPAHPPSSFQRSASPSPRPRPPDRPVSHECLGDQALPPPPHGVPQLLHPA